MNVRRAIGICLIWLPAVVFAADPAPQAPAGATPPAAQAKPNEAKPAAAPKEGAATGAKTAQQPAGGARAKSDRLDLDTTVVTGNRELPKVLYIVPWKKADLGDLPAQPFNTLLDEVLTPVDRDVFRREVTYYGVVSGGGNPSPAATGNPGAPARGDEK